MQTLYHMTRLEYLDDILGNSNSSGRGLLPRSQTGKEGWQDSVSNPDFVYLSKKPVNLSGLHAQISNAGLNLENDGIERVSLEVQLSDDHPLERDYDQLLAFSRIPDGKLKELGFDTDRRALYGSIFEALGVEFDGDISEDNLKETFDRVPQDKYDEMSGFYRTDSPIPASQLSEYKPPESPLAQWFGQGNIVIVKRGDGITEWEIRK